MIEKKRKKEKKGRIFENHRSYEKNKLATLHQKGGIFTTFA